MSPAPPFGSSTKPRFSHRSLCTVWPATATSPDVAAYASEENPPYAAEYRPLVLIKKAPQSLPKSRALNERATLVGRGLTSRTGTRLWRHCLRLRSPSHPCRRREAISLEIDSMGLPYTPQRAECRDNQANGTRRRPRADKCPSPVEHSRYLQP